MKALLAATAALLALTACSESVPTAAENECRTRHGLTPGSAVYADCVKNLGHSESELRKTR